MVVRVQKRAPNLPADPSVRKALFGAWESRASGLLSAGRNEEAIVVLKRLAALRPDQPGVLCELIKALYRKGDFFEASRLCGAALRGFPGHWELLLLNARLLEAGGRLEKAAESCRQACAAARGRLEPYFYLAEMLQRLDKTAEMFKILGHAEREAADAPETLPSALERFRLSILRCDFKSAAERGERILDRTRILEQLEVLRWPVFIEEFDLTYGSRRFHQAALSSLGRFIRSNPHSPWGYYYRVIFLKSLQDKATRAGLISSHWGRMVKRDLQSLGRKAAPRHGWMLMEKAKESLFTMDFPAALREFRLAAGASEPASWYARCQSAEILACMGRVDSAREEFARAEREAPQRELGNVLVWKGEFHLWIGEYRRALRCEEEGLRRGHQYAHCWMGGALLKLGRPGPALKALDRAVAVSPWDLEARVWRAETLLRLERAEEALRQAQEAVAGGENFYGRLLRALARAALMDWKGCRRDYVDFPAAFKSYIQSHLGDLSSNEDLVKGLEWVLERSRGVRRGGPSLYAWLPRSVRL